jgi:hypothetical protein
MRLTQAVPPLSSDGVFQGKHAGFDCGPAECSLTSNTRRVIQETASQDPSVSTRRFDVPQNGSVSDGPARAAVPDWRRLAAVVPPGARQQIGTGISRRTLG